MSSSLNRARVRWRFICLPASGKYKLTVMYFSDAPPAQHEAIHKKLRDLAFEFLKREAFDPKDVSIECTRVEVSLEEAAEWNAKRAMVSEEKLKEELGPTNEQRHQGNQNH